MGPPAFTYVTVAAKFASAIPTEIVPTLALHVFAPFFAFDALPTFAALLELEILDHLPLLLLFRVVQQVLLAGTVSVVGAGLAAEAPGAVAFLAVHFDLAFVGLCILHSALWSQTLQVTPLLQRINHQSV